MGYGYRIRARRGFALGAAGFGTSLAAGAYGRYRKNRMGVKKPSTKKVVKPRYKRRVGLSQTQTVTRRKKSVNVSSAIEHREVSIKQRGKTLSTRALAYMSLEPQWFRVQGITQFDTSSGFYALSTRRNTTPAPNIQYLPVHVWDLTCLPQGANQAPVGFALFQQGVTTNGTFQLNQTDPTGAVVANNNLQNENITNTFTQPWRKSLHDFTHIKLNLYGVRNRATKFMVQIIQLTDEYADFITGAQANVEKAKVYDYLARPFMYNNLNIGDPQTKVDIKVIKQFTTIIDSITLDQVGAANAIPKIQTVNWFIKHNRMRLYDWRRNDTPDLNNNAAYDIEQTNVEQRVDPKKRIYMVIRAMSPTNSQVAGITPTSVAPDVNTEPSYDCVIRQKHWFSI